MKKRPLKIGIAGTHSTGKSGFLSALSAALSTQGLVIGRVGDLAVRARNLGFPILANHTFESTLWIMAEGMRQEAEASLTSDVILVDRPVPDALGYLLAGLEITRRSLELARLEQLRAIARAHAADYDLLIVTVMDPTIALPDDRDQDRVFRIEAERQIAALMQDFAPQACALTSDNSCDVLAFAIDFVVSRRTMEKSI